MHKFVSGMLAVTVIGVAGMARPAAAQQGSQRFAFVNSQLILKQTPGFAQAESTFTREVEAFRAEVARLQATLDSAVRGLQPGRGPSEPHRPGGQAEGTGDPAVRPGRPGSRNCGTRPPSGRRNCSTRSRPASSR